MVGAREIEPPASATAIRLGSPTEHRGEPPASLNEHHCSAAAARTPGSTGSTDNPDRTSNNGRRNPPSEDRTRLDDSSEETEKHLVVQADSSRNSYIPPVAENSRALPTDSYAARIPVVLRRANKKLTLLYVLPAVGKEDSRLNIPRAHKPLRGFWAFGGALPRSSVMATP